MPTHDVSQPLSKRTDHLLSGAVRSCAPTLKISMVKITMVDTPSSGVIIDA
jgi:hypothetical protein